MKLTILSSIKQTSVSINDRAFNYGDGFFATMRCAHHSIQLLDLHIQRLKSDARRLGFSIDNWDELVEQLEASALLCQSESVIKVLISRGEGGRGYSQMTAQHPIALISTGLLPSNPSSLRVSVAQGFLAEQPLLAGIKHLNRLEQVLFKRQADELGLDDVLCLDIHQHLIETSSANLFWYKDGKWFTPELSRCGVNGVFRQFLLALFSEYGIDCMIGEFGIHELVSADSVFVCNAVRGMIPVGELLLPMNRKNNQSVITQQLFDEPAIRFSNDQCQALQSLITDQLQRVDPPVMYFIS